MWGWILGGASLALALYELWTRPTAAEIAAAATAANAPKRFDAGAIGRYPLPAGKPGGGGMPAGGGPAPKQAQLDCSPPTQDDYASAEAWTAGQLGAFYSLKQRLDLMQSTLPIAMWPRSAQRVWCVLKGS